MRFFFPLDKGKPNAKKREIARPLVTPEAPGARCATDFRAKA